MALSKYPTPQDLQNWSRDGSTLDKFATDPVGVPNINRKGNDVQNLETLRRTMLDAASAAANIKTYLTRASMAADTSQPISTTGRVTNDPVAENNGDWVWNGVEWAWSAIQPASVAVVESLLPNAGVIAETVYDEHGSYRISLVDNEGRLLLGLGDNVLKWGDLRIERGTGGSFALSDATYRTPIRVDEKGRMYVASLSVGKLAVLEESSPSFGPARQLQFGGHRRTGIMHIAIDGQSLGRGVASTPPISLVQQYSNVTFASGVHLRAGDVGYIGTGTVPLVESLSTGGVEGDLGETPASGICNGLSRRLEIQGEDPADWVFLGHTVGLGGQTLESASQGGSGTFEGMLKSIDDAFLLASSRGIDYSFWAHVWIQGEANIRSDPMTTAKKAMDYVNGLIAQDQDLADYIAEKNYQNFRHALITYQTCAHRRYSTNDPRLVYDMLISNAQWAASKQYGHVVLAAPVYMMPHSTEDYLHLSNEGSWLLGQYISRAIYETCAVKGKKWRPLEPISVAWLDTSVEIAFHVPHGKLVLDDALCTATTNGGFDIWEDGELADIISSVSVIGQNQLRLELSRPPSQFASVSYAKGRDSQNGRFGGPVNGPRGNVRDTHGDADAVISPLGNMFYLHNACVMFEHHRVNGFA